MKIDLITLFPEIFDALRYGIVGRAQKQRRLELAVYPLRDYTNEPSRRIDDRPYGGGPGMVMAYEPLANAINAAKAADKSSTCLIYLSPQGKTLDQAAIQRLAEKDRLTLLCGRYEGIDERVIEDFIDEEWSVGDYVVSGGELPALVLIDAITRLLPGALGHAQSAKQDSFTDGLLDCPHYTRPEVINQRAVPKILLSGDHHAIEQWRLKQALGKTWQKRPDLLKKRVLSEGEQALLNQYIRDAQTTED